MEFAQALAPHRRVLFLDTDSMPAPEVRAGDALSNPGEAAVITDIVRALDLGKVSLEDIGIISPYRAQVSIAIELYPQMLCACFLYPLVSTHLKQLSVTGSITV